MDIIKCDRCKTVEAERAENWTVPEGFIQFTINIYGGRSKTFHLCDDCCTALKLSSMKPVLDKSLIEILEDIAEGVVEDANNALEA